MAGLETVIRVGPGTHLPSVLALLDALVDGHAGRLRSVCDNRDEFRLRPAGESGSASDLEQVRAALAFACGVERDPAAAGWATTAYYDVATASGVPEVAATCALGRRSPSTGEAGAALSLGCADAAAWEDLGRRARRIADGWPDIWRWMTVGYRFCPLDYNGLHHAHTNVGRVAPRMPAVDVGDTLGLHTSYWTTRLRTVSWATLVAADLAALCAPALRGPATGVEILRLAGGGAGVRVHGEPQPGASQRHVPRGLVEADRLLRPARAHDDVVFLPPWDADSTREWLDRWQTLAPNAP